MISEVAGGYLDFKVLSATSQVRAPMEKGGSMFMSEQYFSPYRPASQICRVLLLSHSARVLKLQMGLTQKVAFQARHTLSAVALQLVRVGVPERLCSVMRYLKG